VTRASAGNKVAAKTARMAMTTNSSTKVNATPRRWRRTEGSNWQPGVLEIIF
jgi:hypothetical protein